MKSIIFLLMTLLALNVSAQHTIRGTVKDANAQPLEFSNVVLYNSATKTLITGSTTNENGNYTISNSASGSYYIEVSMLGYESKTSEVFNLNSDKTLDFVLKESSESLSEVVVKAKRPVIRQTAEKLILDLEQAELVSTNLQDVMKRVPGVLVTNNGISYAGSSIRILINGKTTEYMDIDALLRDFPADNIAKVELIEQPGAELDAEGSGPIINIILKKHVTLGNHGTVKAWVGEDEGVEYGTSASIASYKNKINWQLGAGYSSPTWREDLYIKRYVTDTLYDQITKSPYNPKTTRFNAGLDYFVATNHTIGLSGRFITTDSERSDLSNTTISNSNGQAFLISENAFQRQRNTYNVNPYYDFKTEKHHLSADFNYVYYNNDNTNTLFNTAESDINASALKYSQQSNYTIKAFKIDYKRSFSEQFSWQSGSKYSQVDTDNDLKTFVDNNGNFELVPENSNIFTIDEQLFALYSKVNATYNSWSFSGGLRFEDSKTIGTASNSDEAPRVRHISKLFPSASLTKKVTENISTTLSYSYRIRRPAYSTLNAFVQFYDPLSSDKGNPNLSPSFTNNFQLNLTYDGQPFFSVGHRSTKDALFQFISQNDQTAQIERTTINLSERKNWFLRAFAPLNFIHNDIGGYTGVIVNYNKYASEELTPVLTLSKWNLIWFTQAEYTFPYDINAEFSAQYGTGVLEGQIEMDWFAGMDFGMSKTFLDGQLKAQLGIRKILNRAFHGTLQYNNINADIISDQSRQNVYLNLSYKFGSKFNKKTSKRSSTQEEENRINDNN